MSELADVRRVRKLRRRSAHVGRDRNDKNGPNSHTGADPATTMDTRAGTLTRTQALFLAGAAGLGAQTIVSTSRGKTRYKRYKVTRLIGGLF